MTLRAWKGLAPAVLHEAGVALDEHGLVRVPYRAPDGSEYAAKLFGTRSCWWSGVDGRGLIPFGLETLPRPAFARYCALVVCEGESDALAVRDAFGNREGGRAVAWYSRLRPEAGTRGMTARVDVGELTEREHRPCGGPREEEDRPRRRLRLRVLRVRSPAGAERGELAAGEEGGYGSRVAPPAPELARHDIKARRGA